MESLRLERMQFIRKYIEHLSDHLQLGMSAHSLKTSVGQFQKFVTWCDVNFTSAFDNKELYVNAVRLYTEELILKIRSNTININTASASQLVAISTGRKIYKDTYNELFRSVRKISRSYAATIATEVPDEVTVKRAIKIYQQIFLQLSDFVINFDKFPQKIEIEDQYYWHFPASIPFAGPSNINSKKALKQRFKCYDYELGRIRSTEEIEKISEAKGINLKYLSRNSLNKANENLQSANEDKYHKRRLDAATFALQAFIMLFSANTGMNLGQINAIKWSNDFEIKKDRQGFKGIKNRSNGKIVEFYISNKFYPTFNKFLLLRKYILESTDTKNYPTLFFKVTNRKLHDCEMNISTYFNNRVHNCFGVDIKVTTRMWRALKADWLVRNTDINIAATILQNKTETTLKHYTSGSQISHENELSSFFRNYKTSLIAKPNQHTDKIIAGNCIKIHTPRPIKETSLQLDCNIPESCLFCDKYRVHADTVDLKKLLSMKYVLELSLHLAHNQSHYEKSARYAIDRIDTITETIIKNMNTHSDEIELIISEVSQEGNLTKYWNMKLKMLEDIGLLT